jgi:hypothetical protein
MQEKSSTLVEQNSIHLKETFLRQEQKNYKLGEKQMEQIRNCGISSALAGIEAPGLLLQYAVVKD